MKLFILYLLFAFIVTSSDMYIEWKQGNNPMLNQIEQLLKSLNDFNLIFMSLFLIIGLAIVCLFTFPIWVLVRIIKYLTK